jgi:RNA polymerase sigma-70 factor (ECF subfamily)
MAADEELVKKFLQGDENSFRELVERYQKPLLNYIYRFTARRELAEELAQEIFIAVLQHLQRFDTTASFKAWIYAIATNRALNSLRRREPVMNEELIAQTMCTQKGPFSNAAEEERAVAVRKALAALPEKHRAVFILRFYQDLSYEEIALAIGCPLGTVKSRMCYALQKLRGLLWAHREVE